MDVTHFTRNNEGVILEIPNIDKLCQIIKCKFEDQEYQNDYLLKENKKLKDEHYRDDEIQRLQAKLKEYASRAFFDVTAEEQKAIEKWQKGHKHDSGAIGGLFTYRFTPTSVGVIGTIKCNACKKMYTFRDLG